MAAVDTGKSFANGEQLTAAKLNQMFGNSTFAAGAVDNSTMTVNSLGQLAVNQITSSNIPANAVETSDLAQVQSNQFLGRTATGTGDVSAIDISAIATLLRPSGTTATGGTTQTNGSDGTFDPADNRTNLNRQVTSGTTDVDFVYNINQFTGTASDFHYSKITGIMVRTVVSSDGNTNGISVINSAVFGSRYALGVFKDATGTNQRVKIQPITWIPIAPSETTFTIRHNRNDDSRGTEHSIVGFTYMPNLPEVTF